MNLSKAIILIGTLIMVSCAKKELYNLKENISESNDITSEHPVEVERLHTILKTWESELIEPQFLGLIHISGGVKN